MSTLPTRIEREGGRRLAASEIVRITGARERTLSRVLMLYLGTGLVFMLLPGTFLGVWNLFCIQSPHYVCTPGPRYRSATSSRIRVIKSQDDFPLLSGYRTDHSSTIVDLRDDTEQSKPTADGSR